MYILRAVNDNTRLFFPASVASYNQDEAGAQ